MLQFPPCCLYRSNVLWTPHRIRQKKSSWYGWIHFSLSCKISYWIMATFMSQNDHFSTKLRAPPTKVNTDWLTLLCYFLVRLALFKVGAQSQALTVKKFNLYQRCRGLDLGRYKSGYFKYWQCNGSETLNDWGTPYGYNVIKTKLSLIKLWWKLNSLLRMQLKLIITKSILNQLLFHYEISPPICTSEH